MQKIHHFHQRLLRLLLTCHVLEGHAGLFLNINFCLALADTHHAAATHAAHQIAHGHPDKNQREQAPHHLPDQRGNGILDIGRDLDVPLFEHGQELFIVHLAGIISNLHVPHRLRPGSDLPGEPGVFHLLHLILLQHIDKCIVGDLLGACILPEILDKIQCQKAYQHKH